MLKKITYQSDLIKSFLKMAAAHTGMCHRADEQELLYVNLERFTYNAENVSDYVFFPE